MLAYKLRQLLDRTRVVKRSAVQGTRTPSASPGAGVGGDSELEFSCNLCGQVSIVARSLLGRETASCKHCGSTVRFRAIARLVAVELFGREDTLQRLPRSRSHSVLGLSDALIYAVPLGRIVHYENTYFDREPRLDITDVPQSRHGRYDLLIASDVFEHVLPPVQRAFDNARKLLRPGGKFIFTVPFSVEKETREHFPALHEWKICQDGNQRRLLNQTAAGELQVFDNLVFHGGPGATLEMREFGKEALEQHFLSAGFSSVRLADETSDRFGIVWHYPWSVPMVAYA
jgi:SAM-dependent methyltransferase